jgi:hypothetical protein
MDETRIIAHGGRRWSIRPEAAEPLLADGWPPEQPERLMPVKAGARRRMMRFESAGRGYYVKLYEPGGPVRRLRAWLGLGPGRREWEALIAARAAGLDVPEPVALALGAPEALVTREIPGGQRLDEYLFGRYFEAGPNDPPYPGARPPELIAVFRRRRTRPEDVIDPKTLAYRLAGLVAQLDEAGLYLPDLHPGNILVWGTPGDWRLALVDLAEAREAASDSTLEHLMQLEHFFEPIATPAERRRCLVRLGELRPGTPSARDVAKATAIYRQRFYLRRDRRTRRQSKYFRRIAAGPWRGWATTDWADAVEALFAGTGGAAPLSAGRATPLKEGRTSTVWRVRLDDGSSLIAKRHNRTRARGAVRGLLGASRSLTAFRRGHALLARGIATARPAAALDLRRGGAVADTILMTEVIENARPLSDWLGSHPPAAHRRHVTWQLARLIQRMHGMGLAHRDLKAPNILVAPASGPDPRPVLVDLDGLVRTKRVSVRRRMQNLMRLSVSLDEWGVARQTDRLRFLRAYLSPRGCPAPITLLSRRHGRTDAAKRLRRWWKRIARLSERKLETLRCKGAVTPG